MTGAMMEITLPKPHKGQRAVWQHPARFKWLSAGRRWRKSTLAMCVAVESSIRGKHILWTAPTYDQCRVGFNEMRRAAATVARFNLSRMEVVFPNGGKVTFRSLENPDNARGHTADGIIMDEAAMIEKRAYFDVIRPIISDTGGWFLALFTPKGRNWVFQECMRALHEPDSMFWQVPTLGVQITSNGLVRVPHEMENPDFSFSEAVSMYRGMPEKVFEAEFLAQFVEDSGTVFRNVRACATAQKLTQPIPGRQYIVGVDLAKVSDFTWFVVGDVLTKEVVYLDYFNQIDYTVQLDRLDALNALWQPQAIVVERNIGEMFIEAAHRRNLPVIPFQTTHATKQVIIDTLAMGFEQKLLKIPDDEMLIGELQAFEIDKTPSGLIKYAAPEGFHDDGVIALALWWYYAAQMSESRSWIG